MLLGVPDVKINLSLHLMGLGLPLHLVRVLVLVVVLLAQNLKLVLLRVVLDFLLFGHVLFDFVSVQIL